MSKEEENEQNGASKNINFRVSLAQLDEIDRWVEELKFRNRTALLHEALRQYLLKLQSEKEYQQSQYRPHPQDRQHR